MNDVDLKQFLVIRRHLRIVHHIPGRLRIRIGLSLFKEVGSIDKKLFDRVIQAIPGIKDVRLNTAAATAVISYTATTIKPDWIDLLISGDESDAQKLLRRLLETDFAPALMVAQQG